MNNELVGGSPANTRETIVLECTPEVL